MSGPFISVTDVKKHFGSLDVLKGIDLTISRGDVVTLIGPSGSGKTTFLRIMNFLETASSGSMQFEDAAINLSAVDKKTMRQIRMKTGFVFQNYNLWQNKTALQNVMLPLTAARKIPKNEASLRAHEALKKVNLDQFADYYPYQLSGGQQQRVAIARAIVTSPDIIFFVEPTSALDPELTGEVLEAIKQLAEDGMTMMIVTHEMAFARNISNRVIFMERGIIVEQGHPEQIFEHPISPRTREFIRGY